MKKIAITYMALILALLIAIIQTAQISAEPAEPTGITYYVSQSDGEDNHDGLSEGAAFQTITKVNNLDLMPGDQVLFKCGDTWHAEPLVIVKSGASGAQITFGSYPQNCEDKPVLSGAQPIFGWQTYAENIYVADLNAGENAGKFSSGVNQLFKDNERLLLGRWPNLDAGDGGYASIDSQPSSNQIQDAEMPSENWNGAIAHIRGMRWYILNREVTGTSGSTLTMGDSLDCWGADCTGWGYFLNNHIKTLDQDGEWFYDTASHKVYLYSTSGSPANGQVEGSVILRDDQRASGGIILGEDLYAEIAYVTVENLAVQRWFRHGISTPTNLQSTENHHLVIQDNSIHDVDGIGLNLATWVWDADNERNGWRGGYHITVSGNTIERANRMGINTYTRQSSFINNTIRDIGRIEYLGAAGMGCALNASGGSCTEDGDGIRVKIGEAIDTGNNNSFSGNRLERIGYNGFDVFGYNNTFEHNVILEACISKGDCGGVRTFGRDNLTSTTVHDLSFIENMIVDTLGNTDGCHENYVALFGFGLYFDHYSRDITVQGNTIISSTVHGILFQNATGSVLDNTLYNNGRTYPYAGAQVLIGDAPALVGTHTGNILFSLNVDARTLSASSLSQLGNSDQNDFFNPYRSEHIRVNGDKTLSNWQAYSGFDSNSQEHWYTLQAGDAPRSRIFYNDTNQIKTFSLGSIIYADLDQIPVFGELTLAPYQSKILIETELTADLAISMDLLSSMETAPGAPLTYTISISNQGLTAASQVRLENPLPVEIINSNWESSPGSVDLETGSRYTWEIDQLAIGETYTFTVTGRYSETLIPDMPVMLTAMVSTATPETDLLNNQGVILLGAWKSMYLPVVAR
jgi:uncharacterized repeat protein (TIGR01451 family)